MNIICVNNYLKASFDDGTTIERHDATPELLNQIKSNLDRDKDTLMRILNPEYGKAKSILENADKSIYIEKRGQSFYIPSISELTMPTDFVEAFLQAEADNDDDKITAYLNFWTLVSLNPDSRVRNNLFWFLKRWGMVISKSGLIVAYRNADIKYHGSKFSHEYMREISKQYAYVKYVSKKNPNDYVVFTDPELTVCHLKDVKTSAPKITLSTAYREIVEADGKEETVYTDHHSHTFEIRLGHIVSMPREAVDSDQEHTCSSGLHCAGKDWLEKNYFGTVGMRVLVNPADVCGIPTQDNYGKMRVCAYYPVNIVDFDEEGRIVDQGIESGFEDDFISKITYTGEVNNVDVDNYTLEIPNMVEIDKEKVYDNLRNIYYSIHG